MEVLSDKEALRLWRKKDPATIILVPTMGALHDGHLSLIRRAKQERGRVLVTIFVNPLQFDESSDFENYPATLEDDLKACEEEGVDAVFAPQVDELYAADRSVIVLEQSLSGTLCGATREGHFDGVCTVVLKLFMLSGAAAAVFGEKDYQQLAIIRRMVRDLDIPIKIIGSPTVREHDGLAMSSRNVRLSGEQRLDASRVRRALAVAAREDHIADMLAKAREELEASPCGLVVDYLQVVDAESLQVACDLSRPVVIAVAVFYGDVRLIDNVQVDVS